MAIGKKLKSLVDKIRTPEGPATPWLPKGAPYPLLASFDPAAVQPAPGLIAVWHLGVRPQWLKVATTANLQAAIRSAVQNAALTSYRPNGGVYLAWAPLAANDLRGAARHLIDRLKPVLQAVRLDSEIDVPTDAKPAAFPFPLGTEE